MNSNQIVYEKIPAEQVAKLVAELPNYGSTVQSQGTGIYAVIGHGVSATAVYDGSTLTITVTKKPFYVSMDMIQRGMDLALGIQPTTAGAPIVMVPVPQAQAQAQTQAQKEVE